MFRGFRSACNANAMTASFAGHAAMIESTCHVRERVPTAVQRVASSSGSYSSKIAADSGSFAVVDNSAHASATAIATVTASSPSPFSGNDRSNATSTRKPSVAPRASTARDARGAALSRVPCSRSSNAARTSRRSPKRCSNAAPARTGRHESRAERSTSRASSSGSDSARVMTPPFRAGLGASSRSVTTALRANAGSARHDSGISARLCRTSPWRSGCSSSPATQSLIAVSSLNVVHASSHAMDRSPPVLPLLDRVSRTNSAAFG